VLSAEAERVWVLAKPEPNADEVFISVPERGQTFGSAVVVPQAPPHAPFNELGFPLAQPIGADSK